MSAKNVLRLSTAYETTLVVSDLSAQVTQPRSCIIAEFAVPKGRVSERLRGHHLAELLGITAGGLDIDGIDFTPAPSQRVTDYLLNADGVPASGIHVPSDGGYGEAAIANRQPATFELDAHFTAAIVAIVAEFASGIRPKQSM